MKENLVDIYNKANKIINSDLDYKKKHELIFSESIYLKTIDYFNWIDPETDHRDDVKAFMIAFENYMEKDSLIKK